MKAATFALAIAIAAMTGARPVWAGSATATVSATVPARSDISLIKDSNSVTRFSAGEIRFDRTDDQDPGVSSPSAGFMYAPYRSEINKNWHLASIIANGSSLSLSVAVTGTAGTQPLASILRVWCGGFFTPGATTPLPGTATVDDGVPTTDDWEVLNGFTRNLSQPFTGTVPFNYRLSIGSLLGPATYTGTVTYTLTSG